jgi:hypothetical protein
MFRAIRVICKRTGIISSAFIASLWFATGCAVFEEKAGPKPVLGPQEKIFYAEFDDVWRATQLALQSPTSYPLRVNNMDTGILETELIKGSMTWTAPHVTEPPSGGLAYRLVVRVIKGNVGVRHAHKVIVLKDGQMQRDFFSDPEPIPSDGLEEKVILYRIDRELQIDRALKRANKRQNQSQAK